MLAHGIARFDAIFAAFGIDLYFKQVPEYLAEHGFQAHRCRVDFAGAVEKRSRQLRAEVERILEETADDKVHIIAHSMGGLDARHMIVDLGMADRVASLTTIGTPHRGTSFADFGLARGDAAIDLLQALGIDLEGFRDLSTAACREFNERAEDSETANPVRYQVYSSFQEKSKVVQPLQPSWQIIQDQGEGDNDGLVPVTSQEWTPSLANQDGLEKVIARRRFPFGADHLNQTGCWDPNELARLGLLGFFRRRSIGDYERRVRDVYLEIARDVSDAGERG